MLRAFFNQRSRAFSTSGDAESLMRHLFRLLPVPLLNFSRAFHIPHTVVRGKSFSRATADFFAPFSMVRMISSFSLTLKMQHFGIAVITCELNRTTRAPNNKKKIRRAKDRCYTEHTTTQKHTTTGGHGRMKEGKKGNVADCDSEFPYRQPLRTNKNLSRRPYKQKIRQRGDLEGHASARFDKQQPYEQRTLQRGHVLTSL